MARKLGTICLTVLASFVCAGCMGKSSIWAYPHARLQTGPETPDEHHERVAQILERDRRTLGDDLDLLFQTDRPTRLSKFHGK